MITNLNKETMKYFGKEALEQFGTLIGKARIELSADFVMDAIGKKVEFTTNDKGRRSATYAGEKIGVRDAEKILRRFASIQVQLEDGDLTNCPVKYERKLAEAISEITIAQVAAKQAEFDKDPLIGKTVRVTEQVHGGWDHQGANRGTIITIDRREIDGYIGLTQKKRREVLIPNREFRVIEVLDPEALEVSQPEPAEITPDNESDQLSINEGFFNAQTERKTTRPMYLLVERYTVGGTERSCFCGLANRPENLHEGDEHTVIETREAVWCEEFETDPEEWEQTEAFEKYQRSHEKGYPAVDVGDPWNYREPQPWLDMIAQLKALGLPLMYAERSTAWARDLAILQDAGYTFGKLIEIQDLHYGCGSTEKALLLNY
ncbi:MAG: hypothetical protein Q4A17_04500 [Thermoguttaceae bacterium]|nr:hypothetical protein [Thermoguttaceae bacterium]